MKKKEVWYAVIGGVVGAVVVLLSGLLLDNIRGQSDRNFGEITCTGLKVRSVDVPEEVWIFPGIVIVRDENGKKRAEIGLNQYGNGGVSVAGKNGEGWATMRVDQHGTEVFQWQAMTELF